MSRVREDRAGSAYLDIGDTLKVGYEVLDESLPRLESFDEDIGRS